mmetsp:Transcript_13769/g.40264  ORF Transcript_13769/g.40264 Transcript_13769/m.40264 type:complete len:97 (+) Transcript_13769:367-657(+)
MLSITQRSYLQLLASACSHQSKEMVGAVISYAAPSGAEYAALTAKVFQPDSYPGTAHCERRIVTISAERDRLASALLGWGQLSASGVCTFEIAGSV